MAALQYVHIRAALAMSWVQTTTPDALFVMAGVAAAALLANPAAAAFAILSPRPADGRRTFILLVAGAIAAGALLLLLANAVRPVVVDRYLLPVQAAICAVLAATIAGAIRGWKLWAVAACCALSIGITAFRQSREIGWAGTRDFIAGEVRACPATQVYAISPWRLRSSRDSRAAAMEAPVFADAYRLLAREAGFAVSWVQDSVRVLRLPAACPALLWIEHSGGKRLVDAASLLRDADLGFDGRVRVSRFATDDGVVLIAEGLER